jgi:GT2 family glycosyltransferase
VPRVSIVVPTHARRESVLRLLRSLGQQTADPRLFEVVVSIDGADDSTAGAIDALSAPFILRYTSQPHRGRAAACNAGAREATGEIILFVDDDMEAMPAFVAAHVAAHNTGGALGVVGAAPIVVVQDAPPIVRYRAAGFSRKMARLASNPGNVALTDVYTGNFSLPRDLFFSVSGYDEEFRLYGHEDYDLALRLGRTGVKFVFDPSAIARQHYAKSFRSLAVDTEAEGSTAVLFVLKHPEVFPAMQISHYGRRPRLKRARLAALLALSRIHRPFRERMLASVEKLERRCAPSQYPTLFARYDLVFDLLYWLGVERALGEQDAPGMVAFRDVERRIAATARHRPDSDR